MSERQDLLVDGPYGCIVVDEACRILAANDRLIDWLGFSATEIGAKSANEIFSMASRIVFETSILPLLRLQGEVSGASLDLKAKDGRNIPVLMSAEKCVVGSDDVIRIAFLVAGARRDYERDLVRARSDAEAMLSMEKREGELREQFVAILGHDLRNPVASISSGISLLSREPLRPHATEVIGLMRGSMQRMARLIDNILDFARNRLGGGIALDLSDGEELEAQILQAVNELRAVSPDHEIQASLSIKHVVRCDVWRIGQMVSNLLGNALTHGDPDHPVTIHAATCEGGGLDLWVSNRGTAIPPSIKNRLFDPFVRSDPHENRRGLGLGLYIAAEIAKAHGGLLEILSDDNETRFTFRMPKNEFTAQAGFALR